MNIFRRWFVEFRYHVLRVILPFPKVLSNKDTLELLINSKKSIVRYGDGEFHMIGKTENLGFQQINLSLSQRLTEILTSNKDSCLIALPVGLHTVKGFNRVGSFFWKQFIVFHYRKYSSFLDFKKTYSSANVTRPYMDFLNKKSIGPYFERMKCLWKGKHILIVEGEMSRLGVGNDLFADTAHIDRIITLSQDAYSVYSTLLDSCKEIIMNYDLVLLSLGPTATVLGYDLSDYGVQVIDIGHIDLEYEWFTRGVTEKVAIYGKHVNELSYSVEVEASNDESYLKQIIKTVKN